VDLREVKEIRVGKNSKDFERWSDDAKRMENMKCFVVFYGLEFRLKTLSIAGNNYITGNQCKNGVFIIVLILISMTN
jgi:hypothetical protein